MKQKIFIIILIIILFCIANDKANCSTSLNSAISVLKVLSGDNAISYTNMDIDQNDTIEIIDAIKILQNIVDQNPNTPEIVLLIPTDIDKLTIAWLPIFNSSTSMKEMIYEVHLSKTSNFEPLTTTLKCSLKGETQADITNLEPGATYYSLIVAIDQKNKKIKSNNYASATIFSEPLLTNKSIVYDSDINYNLINATQSSTVFSYDNYTETIIPSIGSILFSNVNHDYFIRKIDSINTTSKKINIQTSDAELSEVFNQATVNTHLFLFNLNQIDLPNTNKRNLPSGKGRQSIIQWKNQLLTSEQIDHIYNTNEISLVPVLDNNDSYRIRMKKGIDSNVDLNANVEFTPELETNISWTYDFYHGIKIINAKVIAKGILSAIVSAAYKFSSAYSVSKEIPFPLFTRTYRTLYFLGNVPVYQRIIFTLNASVSASASSKIEADASAEARASIKLGAIYTSNEGWKMISPTSDFERFCTANITIEGSVEGELRLIPNIKVEFYRVFASDLSIEPFIKSSIKAELLDKADILMKLGYIPTRLTQVDLFLQAEAFVGVSMGVFSKKIPLLEKTNIYTSPKWKLFSLPKLEITGDKDFEINTPIVLKGQFENGINNPFNVNSVQWLFYPETLEFIKNDNSVSFIAKDKGQYTIFFSGDSRINSPIGKQFVYKDINVGEFRIERVDYPKEVISCGDTGDLYVWWKGTPTFPLEMITRPNPNWGCPQGGCITASVPFTEENNPLFQFDRIQCCGYRSSHYADFEVLLRDANGNETQPVSIGFTCRVNK